MAMDDETAFLVRLQEELRSGLSGLEQARERGKEDPHPYAYGWLSGSVRRVLGEIERRLASSK